MRVPRESGTNPRRSAQCLFRAAACSPPFFLACAAAVKDEESASQPRRPQCIGSFSIMGKGKDTSVKVGVRMRPLTKKEIDRGDKVQAFEADR